MAQDFVALIEGRADLSKAKQEFDSFKKLMEQPIKITVDTSGFNTVWGNLQKQAQQAGGSIAKNITQGVQGGIRNANIKFDPMSSIKTGYDPIADVLKMDAKLADDLVRQLNKVKQEGGILQGFKLGDGGNSFEATIKNGEALIKVFSRLKEEKDAFGTPTGFMVWEEPRVESMVSYTNAIKQAQREADSLEQNIKKVMDAFSQGSFDKEMAKIQSSLANLGKDVDPNIAKKAFDKAIEYQRSATAIRDSLNGTSANPLQGQDLVDMYSKAEVALRSFKNAMEELNAVARANGVETGNAVRQAQQEADKLAQSFKTIQDSFSSGTFSSTFDANVKRMESNLSSIASTVSSETIKKASDAASEYYSIMQEIQATMNGTAQNPLTQEQVISQYEKAQSALKRYGDAWREVRIEQSETITEGQANKNADAVKSWCNKNSKALKKYGADLDEIQKKMRTTFDPNAQRELQQQAQQIYKKAGAEGLTGLSFFDQVKKAFGKIGQFTGIYAVTSQIRQVPEEMVREVIKIDSSMTELRKVSTASATEIKRYFDDATESAFKYGQAINEVIDSTASWTRLGYDLKDASVLTDVTAELAKVGSGLNVDTATEGLQATLKGFGLAADEAKRVGDMINYVADTEPIDALGIINGLERSSAAMSEANNSLEESIGLITASTSVTQDATAAGTAWRTISMRIRGAKTELEAAGEDTSDMVESVSKLREQVLDISGVDILESNGKDFKSTTQIMRELAQVYDKLDGIDQANLLEMLGGKRGGNVIAAALKNWDIVEDTIKGASLESVDSMDKQLEIYNQSIQASLDKFHVAFQELSYDLINSDTIKGVVDLGTTIIKIIDELVEHIGVLGTALTGLGIAKIVSTAVSGAKSVEVAADGVELLGAALEAAEAGGSGLGGTLKGLSGVLGTLGAKAGGAGSALGGLFSNLGGFLMSPVGIAAGVTALIAGVALYRHKIKKEQEEELRKQATAATEKWTNDKSSIDEYKAQYTELNDQLKNANLTESERIGIKQQLLDLQNQINEKYGADVSNLDLINGKYETQLNLISQIVEKEAHRSLQDNREAYQQSVDEMTKSREYTMWSNGSNSNLMKQIEWAYIRSGFKDQGDLSFKFTGDVTQADESIRTLMDRLEVLKDTASETEKQFIDNVIGSASKLLKTNTEILQANQDNYRAYLEKSLYDDGFGDELAEYSKRMQAYNDALISGDASKINEAKQQLDDYKVTVDEITSAHEEYGDFFDEVANSVDATTEKVYQFKDIIEDGVAESTNDLSEYSDQIFRTVNDIKKLGLDGVDIQAILGNPQDAMYADLSQLAKLWNPDIDLSNKDDLQSFADFLMQAVYGADAFAGEVDLAKSSFEDFMKSASASIDTIDKVNSALVNSFASGGLSARIDAETGKLTGDVQTILDAYKGADVSQVFEKTADGIIVNRDALRELQSEQEKTLKKEFGDRIAEAYDKWKEAISNKDLDAIDYWKEQYDNVRLLATAYDGATSAYQKWLDAQKMGEAGDMYDTVTSTALKRGQELYEQGLVGTNEFRAIAQLYSNEDLSTASIDELTAAYESGYQVVKKYFTDGQDGAQAFADKIVELGYATKDAEDNYEFFNGIDTQKVADDLGISVDLVEAAFKKLGDYGFKINFDFNTPEEALTQFESRLTQLNNKEVKPGVTVDIHNDEQLREIAEYILNLNDEEINAEFNLEGTETVDEVIDKLQEHYEVEATVKTDTSNVQEPQNTTASVNYTTGNVEGIGAQTAVANYTTGTVAPIENQTAKIDYTTSSVAPIENQKAKIDYSTNSVAKIPNQRTGIDYYTGSVESVPDQNATANYKVSVTGLGALPPDGEHRDIYIDVHTKQLYKGTVSRSAFQGMSNNSGIVGGASHARGMLGKVGLKRDESALINELGAEIVVRPSEDSWMIFNNGMPTFASLKKDDVVFNAELTKKLLQTGKADEYAKILGSSHVNGTIKGNAHATVRGGGKFKRPSSTSGGGGNGSGGGDGGSKGSNNNQSTEKAKDFKEVLDKIEIKIDRIERKISNLDTIASNTFNNQASRASALSQSLSAVNLEIIKQTQGYRRYIKQANAVGLDSKLAEKVRNGEIGIQDVKDEELWKKIEEYRKWWNSRHSIHLNAGKLRRYINYNARMKYA